MLIGLTMLLTTFLDSPCAPTPTDNFLPDVIAAPRGADPVWLVDGADGRWDWARDTPTKTLWILKTAEPVRVQGRELKSGSKTRFHHGDLEAPFSEAMVIENPRRESVRPFGATRQTLNTYAFITSYVFYPERGCYQFDIEVEHARRQIVVEIK
jgi:hypothetical protein